LQAIRYILLFLLGAGSLFLSSGAFVDVHLAPKWYSTIFCGIVLMAVCLVFSLLHNADKEKKPSMAAFFCFIVSVLCTAQAVYGILQYAKILPSIGSFRITGSFDNPAGFAACLCAVFPTIFYVLVINRLGQSWFTAITATIIASAIFLSGSRSGMISLIIVSTVFSLYEYPKRRKIKLIMFFTVCLLFSTSYFLKKDSADGRLLIWRCSWEMVKEKPLFGHGYGGFKANYMNFQADYFTQNPDSEYAMLADNVNRPFNEYISLIINYGLVGLLVFLVFCRFLWRSFLRGRQEPLVRSAVFSLLSIAVFAAFSYPLTYPFVWIMVIFNIIIIIYKAKYSIKIPKKILLSAKLLAIPAIIYFGFTMYQRMNNEILWCRIANQSLAGKTEQMLPEYEKLHTALSDNELFLYNYTAELNVAKFYERSLEIGRKCERLWADYDLQMLMADNYEQLRQYEEAEQHYRKAAAMCPVKFMPLYRLVKLYNARGDKARALNLAKIILRKKIKIPSATIQSIKHEMYRVIEEAPKPQKSDNQPAIVPQERMMQELENTQIG
jgi:O-antigen ligase